MKSGCCSTPLHRQPIEDGRGLEIMHLHCQDKATCVCISRTTSKLVRVCAEAHLPCMYVLLSQANKPRVHASSKHALRAVRGTGRP